MSWWDTSGLTNLASQALKNAQKKIDKVLDIDEASAAKKKGLQSSNKTAAKAAEEENREGTQDGEFWSAWLGAGGKKSKAEDAAASSSSSHSSWGVPWNTAGSSSEHVDRGESNDAASDSAMSEERSKKSNLPTPASEVSSLGVYSHQETTPTSPAVQAKNTVHEFSSEISHALPESDKQTEQENMLASESFTTDWQDFPMDGESPEPGEDSHTDYPVLQAIDHENPQDEKTDYTAKSKVKSDEPETPDRNLSSPDNVFREEVGIDSMDPTDRQIAFEEYKSNINIPSVDIDLEPQNTATQNTSVVCPSLPQDVHSTSLQMQNLLYELEPVEEANMSSEISFFVDDSQELNIKHYGGSSKTSSSSSFIAVSEESTTEVVPSLSSSLLRIDMHPEGSSTPVENAHAGVTDSAADAAISASSCASDCSSTGQFSEESITGDSELLDINVDSGTEVKYGTNLLESAETVLAELMMNSDYQKSQQDFMQDYVNISDGGQTVSLDGSAVLSYDLHTSNEMEMAVSDGGQTVSLEGSAILSDDLHTSNEMEIGTSRTSSDLDLPGAGRASSTGSSDTSKLDSSIDTVVERSTLDSQSDVELMEKDPHYSLFGDSQAEGSEIDISGVIHSGQLDDSSQSLSSSYVKCMIEEAMEDLSKTEDSGSDNHSSGEKSESSKVDSELEKSVYSGHESSDEIETTTSSDIEIISAPTPNGDNKYHIPFDLSPLKIALQRTGRDQGHHRSDSQSSSSAHSKAGEMDRLSPERGDGTSWRDDDFHHHDLHAVREETADNPLHPEKLLKLCQLAVQHKLLGGQKLAEMAEVLQARENKLVQLSKENHQLTEDNNILRNQLQQSEEARESETADLTALTEEFAVRIGEAEKKIQAAVKEKEHLKQKLTSTEKEVERRSANSDLQALLDEKSEQVKQLLQEGEKLSKQQLQSSTVIKKLRSKDKENDATIAAQKKKLDEQAKELERLIAVLDSKEDMEKKQADAIGQLNAAVQRQEKELMKVKSDLDDTQEKCRGLQAALDNSYKEIAELHRSNASQGSKAQEAALSAETHVREELKSAMEREQQRFRQEREAFIMQIEDLRLDMARLEKEHNRREDLLRQEVTHLQERQQQDEARSQDLTQSVTSATRPLLRQIENLQATFGAQSAAWERVEKSLTDRLAEAQTALAMAQEKERTANDHVMELSARVTSLEASNSRIKLERIQLATQVESDRSRLEELQDIRNSAVAEFESIKQKLTQELAQLRMDKVYLESQLNVERTRLENERKKNLTLEEQLRQAERPRSRGTPSPSPSMSVSRQESMSGSMYERHSPGTMNWSYHDDGESVSTFGGVKTSVYDSLRQSGAAVVVENLSSQLKLRDGELVHMQSEISQLERTRESMARELVNLTNHNDELLEIKKAHEQLQEQFNELNGRYSAILQMYGEKEEQVQELQLDLQDVKEMYKSQIDALLAK